MQGPNLTQGFEVGTHPAPISCSGWVLHECLCLHIQSSSTCIPGAKEKMQPPPHLAKDHYFFTVWNYVMPLWKTAYLEEYTDVSGSIYLSQTAVYPPPIILLFITLAQQNGCHSPLGLIFHLKASVPCKSCSFFFLNIFFSNLNYRYTFHIQTMLKLLLFQYYDKKHVSH